MPNPVISDAEIADLLAEMAASYEGAAVERKNRAIRNGIAAFHQLLAQRDEARKRSERDCTDAGIAQLKLLNAERDHKNALTAAQEALKVAEGALERIASVNAYGGGFVQPMADDARAALTRIRLKENKT